MNSQSLIERIWRDLQREGLVHYNSMHEQVVLLKALIAYFELYYPGLHLQRRRLDKYKSQNKTYINQKEFIALFILDEDEDDDDDDDVRVLK